MFNYETIAESKQRYLVREHGKIRREKDRAPLNNWSEFPNKVWLSTMISFFTCTPGKDKLPTVFLRILSQKARRIFYFACRACSKIKFYILIENEILGHPIYLLTTLHLGAELLTGFINIQL